MPDRFGGFRRPTYTPVPDELFDELLPTLGHAELKALLYIIRRTFGFKKDADSISFTQFLHGIKTHDGRVLDQGCGIKNATNLNRALQSLEEKGIITATRTEDANGDKATTIYSLHFAEDVGEGVLPKKQYPTTGAAVGVLPFRQGQETGKQQTERQETDNSNHTSLPKKRRDQDWHTIANYLADFALEWHDEVPTPSSATRAYNLYRKSSLSLEQFIDQLYEARKRTKEVANVKKKLPYFFGILEDVLGLKNSHGNS